MWQASSILRLIHLKTSQQNVSQWLTCWQFAWIYGMVTISRFWTVTCSFIDHCYPLLPYINHWLHFNCCIISYICIYWYSLSFFTFKYVYILFSYKTSISTNVPCILCCSLQDASKRPQTTGKSGPWWTSTNYQRATLFIDLHEASCTFIYWVTI